MDRDHRGARYQLELKLQNERMPLYHSTDNFLILCPRERALQGDMAMESSLKVQFLVVTISNLTDRSKVESFLFKFVKLGQQDDSLGKGTCSHT